MSNGTAHVVTVLTSVGLGLLGGIIGGYVVRFFVRRVAPGHDASFGAFCFMLAALGMHGDIDDQSPRYAVEIAKAVGQLAALPLIWWQWFRREPLRRVDRDA